MRDHYEHSTVITGAGQSAIGRRLGRSSLDLTLDASLKAIDDAGLTRADIDGIATYPGGDAASTMGYGGPSPYLVIEGLRLQPRWFSGSAEIPGQLGALAQASMALSAGIVRHVLVYRTVTEATAQGSKGRGATYDPDGHASASMGAFQTPFGAPSAVNWLAMLASRHMHDYGTTREQLGQIPVTCRTNAGRNPAAVYRDPITLEDYLGARMISTPLCLLDCDVPADGSTAFVLSASDVAGDAPKPPVFIEAIGSALTQRFSWDQQTDLAAMAATGAAEHMWTRTSLTAADVDFVELYDGFSILALAWIEALGFCAQGEAGEFLEGGGRIALDGALPLNTHGGQLSAGRTHGFGLIHEAVLQLRGEAHGRQLAAPKVAAIGNGGGPIAGSMLLTSERV
ncbi:thiolase family protein [Jatrophihabitans fulvus]